MWKNGLQSRKGTENQSAISCGYRIRLQSMSDETDMTSGMLRTVDFVDDIGQLQMTWDNGRSLLLVPMQMNLELSHKPNLNRNLSSNQI